MRKPARDEDTFNIVVLGLKGAGKTTFVDHASDIQLVQVLQVPETSTRPGTILDMDLKQLRVDDELAVNLFGASLSQYPDKIASLIAKDQAGLIFLVDSSHASSFPDVRRWLRVVRQNTPISLIVAANKQDRPDATDIETLRAALQIESGIVVVPCVATQRESVKDVILEALYWILDQIEGEDGHHDDQ